MAAVTVAGASIANRSGGHSCDQPGGKYSFNPGAQRSYEKIGFRVEGRARDTLCWEGEWVDSILMSILSTDPR